MGVLTTSVLQASGIAGGDWLILGRLLVLEASTYNMVAAVHANVTSITRWTVDLQDGSTILSGPTTIVPAAAILDTPSSGSAWTLGGAGFNFIDQIPGSFTSGERGVEVQYSFVMSDGTLVKLAVQLSLKPSN